MCKMKRIYDPGDRIEYIDVVKGIGILLLLLSHSMTGESPLSIWIFSFHMPIFFWCTGILNSVKYTNKIELRKKLPNLLWKKALAILIPYIVFSLLIIVWQCLLNLISSGTVNLHVLYSNLMRIVELKGMESMWFLPCLLIAEILFLLVYAYLPTIFLGVLGISFTAFNVIFNGCLPDGILGVAIRALTGFIFICLGFAFGNWKPGKMDILGLYIFAVVLGAICALKNGFTAIAAYEYGNVPLYYISACLTSFGICGICKKLPSMQFIPYYGKNSIILLCTNNLCIEVLRLLDYKITGNFFIKLEMLGSFLFAILLTIMEFPIIYIGMKYFKVLFGILPPTKKESVKS